MILFFLDAFEVAEQASEKYLRNFWDENFYSTRSRKSTERFLIKQSHWPPNGHEFSNAKYCFVAEAARLVTIIKNLPWAQRPCFAKSQFESTWF